MAPGPTKFVIVAGMFNQALVEAMIDTATAEARAGGAEVLRVDRVNGCYEVPLIAAVEIARPEVEALVVLGYIERGETLHGEVMGHVVSEALVRLQLEHRKPIGLGIIGPGATAEQAEVQKLGAARAAVRAALTSLAVLKGLARS